MTLTAEKLARLDELLFALADDALTQSQAAELEQLVLEHPAARLHYLRVTNLNAALRWMAENDSGQRSDTGGQWAVASDRKVESRETRVESEGEWPDSPDSRIANPEIPVINLQIAKSPNLQIPTLHPPLTTLHYWAFSYSVATVLLAIFLLGAWSYTITHPDADSLAVKKSRSTTHSVSDANKTPEFTFVGCVSGMVDCQWSDEATATSPGAGVALNRRYALKSGLMEITYNSGAKVILQGPCEYTVESPRGGYLQVGKLVARVASGQWPVASAKPQAAAAPIVHPSSLIPHPSSLFAVRTPTALVEDLGTEFGVEVLQSGETASHVFQGRVVMKVQGTWDGGRGTGDENNKLEIRNQKSEIVLSAGQSARVERNGKEMPRIIPEQNNSGLPDFILHMPRRKPLGVFNTGVGVQEGDLDLHWQVIARSDDPTFSPRPAVVMPAINPDCYRPNDPNQSQWITLTAGATPLPDNVIYTFQTKFYLSGLVAKSAALRGKFMADDHVRAVRLNGREIALADDRSVSPSLRWDQFSIAQGFVEGENTLEVEVLNLNKGLQPNASNTSPMAVRVELEGYYMSMSATSDMKSTDENKEAVP